MKHLHMEVSPPLHFKILIYYLISMEICMKHLYFHKDWGSLAPALNLKKFHLIPDFGEILYEKSLSEYFV